MLIVDTINGGNSDAAVSRSLFDMNSGDKETREEKNGKRKLDDNVSTNKADETEPVHLIP